MRRLLYLCGNRIKHIFNPLFFRTPCAKTLRSDRSLRFLRYSHKLTVLLCSLDIAHYIILKATWVFRGGSGSMSSPPLGLCFYTPHIRTHHMLYTASHCCVKKSHRTISDNERTLSEMSSFLFMKSAHQKWRCQKWPFLIAAYIGSGFFGIIRNVAFFLTDHFIFAQNVLCTTD